MTKSSKKYKIVPTKAQLNEMKKAWKLFQDITDAYYKNIFCIEENMWDKTGIAGLEFIWIDNECVGIGKCDRQMALIQRGELE